MSKFDKSIVSWDSVYVWESNLNPYSSVIVSNFILNLLYVALIGSNSLGITSCISTFVYVANPPQVFPMFLIFTVYVTSSSIFNSVLSTDISTFTAST